MRNALKVVVWVTAVLLLVALPPIQGGITQTAYNTIEQAGTPLTKRQTVNMAGSVSCVDNVVSNRTDCTFSGTGSQLHQITFVVDGGGTAITTGDLNNFPTADFACTINRTDISGSPSGSITVDIWKAAGAIPTAANKISASAPVTLSSSQLNQAGSITGWTTAVSAGDVFGATVATVSTVQKVTVQIWCQ